MIFQLIGLCLFIASLSYKLDRIPQLEAMVVRFLQERLGRAPYLTYFREIWFLGRTTFALIALVLVTGYNWKLGLSALAVFGTVAGLEKVVKITFNRNRPYSVHDDIQMLQPREPADPSFPSGDGLRIWFLILILTTITGNSLLFSVTGILIATMVSGGRIVFGVHYPTDVLAGTGLGFLGAGTTIWLWRIFQLF